MNDSAATPGWYPDATNDGRLRYWDGEAWTSRFADQEAPDADPDPIVEVAASTSGPASRRPVATVLAIIGWCLALVFGGLFLASWNADNSAARAEADDNAWAISNLCSRAADDPTLLEDWRRAIEHDAQVTGELVSLTASESSIRPLASTLRGLAPRLLALAGAEAFESEDGWGHEDVLEAALYAERATRAIDAWDYTDTRYRILEGQMSGNYSTFSDGLGYAYVIDDIVTACP